MIFGTVKEGNLEILDKRMTLYRSEMVAIVGVRTLTFREFWSCGTPDYHGARDLLASKRWLADVVNAFRTSSFPKGIKVRLASCLLKDMERGWWEEVGRVGR